MPEQATHPTRAELHSYGRGQLSADQATAIEAHISECEPCCETIADLSANDTFVELLQEAEQLPIDQIVDHDGERTNPSAHDIPVPLAEHPRYEIVGLIGRGGMGSVYEARHRKMERTVALKVINREFVRKSEALMRFHREVKTAARLSHPNIVTAYDADNSGDYHFMVMEYVDGVDLSRTLQERGPLPVAEACKYIHQAATGLQHAYEQGMVHRDIKPHNLMVTADGTVKILDFGLASLASKFVAPKFVAAKFVAAKLGATAVMPAPDTSEVLTELTTAGAIMGTPDYISPEQAEDARQADIRSDIYSLGATLYHLLSGRPPFDDGSVMQKLNSHAEVEPERIDSLRDDIPVELGTIVKTMMAKDPDERFQIPTEVAAALGSFTQAHESSLPVRPARKRRRFIRLAVVVAAFVAGVLLFLPTGDEPISGTGKVVALGPDSSQRAVELWVSGDDGLLAQEGDYVRLHFEGWPAAGPDGAFEGEVMSIALTNNDAGFFRALIKADGKEPWPDTRYLRPGVRAKCWVYFGSAPEKKPDGS